VRLHVVYDDEGTILAAAAEVPLEDQIEDQMRPEEGEHDVGFDVPTEFAEEELLKLLPRLRVDIKENRLVERR
jgi:hypothetical protein